ncbi:unnamed protein product [Paramecium sonneborni]|uniref:Uncharacterized protein n=1 Tax=Paramecium sonneborni TaxID=65129 RepID=A0A8S1NUG9_9CILI|nr:unnamed protein product [Paramecium sonneborni]
MQLNDYKINRKLLNFTNNQGSNTKIKYLSRDSSVNQIEQSIYKSLSSSQMLCKSHRNNNYITNKIQQISTIGNIYNKDSAYFNNTSNDLSNIPPIRSLNKDDGDKLIASLNHQIKQQNILISNLKQLISTQTNDIAQQSELNQNFSEKQQNYQETEQNYHSFNLKILQIAQVTEILPYTNDSLEILNQIYSNDCLLQIAIQQRYQRLKLNLMNKWYKATQLSKQLNKFIQQLDRKKLSQYYFQWKRYLSLKKRLFLFNQVKQFRFMIQNWNKWKNYINIKIQFQQNWTKAIQFYSQKLQYKYFQMLKYFYLHYNFQKTEFQNLSFSTRQKLDLFRLSQCINKWRNIIFQRKLLQGKLSNYKKQQQLTLRKKIIRFLYLNQKYYEQRQQTILQERTKKYLIKIFVFLKVHFKNVAFKKNQIKQNKNYFVKYHVWKQWQRKQNVKRQLGIVSQKIIEKRLSKYIEKLFLSLKNNAKYKKLIKQNFELISQKQNNRIMNKSMIIWLSSLLKQRIRLDLEQSSQIIQLKQIDQQQSDEVFELNQIYLNKLEEVKIQDQEIQNLKCIQENQNRIQHELQMQQDKDELQILQEQKNLIQEQINGLKQQNNQANDVCNNDQEILKLQLEMNNSIFNEQQEKYIELKEDYSKIINDYERRIRNLEIHYLEQSKQQKIKIQQIQNDNKNLELQGSRHNSQPEYFSEMKQPNILFFEDKINFNTQNSPEKVSLNQQLIQDEETVKLREDIKKRLAYLKSQMDLNK